MDIGKLQIDFSCKGKIVVTSDIRRQFNMIDPPPDTTTVSSFGEMKKTIDLLTFLKAIDCAQRRVEELQEAIKNMQNLVNNTVTHELMKSKDDWAKSS